MSEAKKVYEAIAKVTKVMSKEGISKDSRNAAQGYQFRGIDDVYNALAPMLADANLCILPAVQSRECVERESAKGGALFYVTVRVDFAFVSAEDGSEHHVITYGEAMDSGDKATNKAMSAAYKYAAMQAFCIPTKGDNDADAQTHEVRSVAKPTAKPPTKPTEEQDKKVADWCAAIETAPDLDKLKTTWEEAHAEIGPWDLPMLVNLIDAAKNKRGRDLKAREAKAA